MYKRQEGVALSVPPVVGRLSVAVMLVSVSYTHLTLPTILLV
ncbi:hypothetical protein JMUB7540_28320 [Staphylococcus aureus]